ncbi:hypothetical protein NPIL_155551 [Nephila pilipes]|uniref:Uncharacterized protein n=1 Tax=Nephila pilipes TaxID=299642 RepID=A0A8X6QEB0_NEPPI|nr:hypothetical protein NPIL_155551 [Nephila pilipes]
MIQAPSQIIGFDNGEEKIITRHQVNEHMTSTAGLQTLTPMSPSRNPLQVPTMENPSQTARIVCKRPTMEHQK